MSLPARSLLLTVLCVLWPLSAAARQDARIRSARSFNTRTVDRGRMDIDDDIRRSLYRIEDSLAVDRPDTFIRMASSSFGWKRDGSDLVLKSERDGGSSRHLTYGQTFHGLPVDRRSVRLNFDRQDRVSLVFSSYEPLAEVSGFTVRPDISALQAVEEAQRFLQVSGSRAADPELVVYPGDAPRLAWRFLVWPKHEIAEYRVVVDAHSGEVIEVMDQTVHERSDSNPFDMGMMRRAPFIGVPVDWGASGKATSFRSDIGAAMSQSSSSVSVDGHGFVFFPDPLHSAGVSYGSAGFVDGNDMTNAQLDAERVEVVLPGLTLNGSEKYVLSGPYVDIVGQNSGGTTVFVPPAESSPDGFTYSRDQSGFEAVNAYYHVDASQRYVQSLGFFDRQNGPVRINPRAYDNDDSGYHPSLNMILLGTGEVDDGEDATVVLHEYGHALLEAAAPGLISSTRESLAFHEGWADYWAVSWLRYLVNTGQVQRMDWRQIFAWDSGDQTIWEGRVMDHTGHYPEDTCTDDRSASNCDPHDDGRLWATTMLDVQDDLGRTVADQLMLLSHMYLSTPVTFRDAAEAVLQADVDYFEGAHIPVLLGRFEAHGLADPAGYPPAISHTPLANTANAGGERTVRGQVVEYSAPVGSVRLFWSSPTLGANEVEMTLQPGGEYEAQMTLPFASETVSYYMTATDSEARVSALPEQAPSEQFEFQVILVDDEPPIISHTPLSDTPMAQWPAVVSASVGDNLALERVWVEYSVSSGNTVLSSGEFDLDNPSGDIWLGTFPVQLSGIASGHTIAYSIHATDASETGNESVVPENPAGFQFVITASGLLRAWGFETGAMEIDLGGDWESGIPASGGRHAHEGTHLGGTVLNGSYSAEAGVSVLQLPRINLRGVAKPFLTFWHWYDLEHDGAVDPENGGGTILDGGLVLYRSVDHPEWTLLGSAADYTGPLASGTGNPYAGSSAFGGYSYGWRHTRLELPSEDSLDVAFVLATDQGNPGTAESFAGWFVDEIRMTTTPPVDSGAPRATEAPQAARVLSLQAPVPIVTIRTQDDLGVRFASLDYTVSGVATDMSGTIRMDMDLADPSLFTTELNVVANPAPGQRVEYSIRLQDNAGQEVRIPGAGTFRIEYRRIHAQTVTESVSTSGAFIEASSGWITTTTTDRIVSSLNLPPLVMAQNSQSLRLEIDHAFRFLDGRRGNVKVSTDDGRAWTVLEPVGGYDGALDRQGHPMDGQSVYVGNASQLHTDSFVLDAFQAETILVRLDVAEPESGDAESDYWSVSAIRIIQETGQDAFSFDQEFKLHAPWPNPFRNRANLSFSLSEASDVDLRIFDVMGRQAAVLVDSHLPAGEHTATFDAGNLSSGTYVVHLRAGGRTASRTIVLLR